jgi:flagellar biogenesis protein FliO
VNALLVGVEEVGLGELFVRMIISLAVVLGIVLGAYVVIKRRRGGGSGSGVGRSMFTRTGRVRTGGRNGLRVLGRTGVARTSSVVAIQFADRVLLIGGNDQAAPTLLAEIDLEGWERATQAPVDSIIGGPASGAVTAPSGLLDALRQATTRRG